MCCTFTFTREKFSFIESRKNQIVHVKNFYDTLLQTVQNEPQIFSNAISSTVVTYEYFKRDFFLIAIFLIIQAKTPAIKTILKITITAIRDCQENPRVFIFGFSNKANQLFYLPFSTNVKFSDTGETRVTTPTVTETQLPWKRDNEDDAEGGAIKQHEFPAWASNKEYLAYNSPSATFLGM